MQPNVNKSDKTSTQNRDTKHHIVLVVKEQNIGSYTTILQSGIFLEGFAGQAIGIFLNNLPRFDMDYIVNRIQTIFLDGNAIDDMEAIFTKTNSVLAISAAMPGLAGAIFRKKSLHAALRTSGSEAVQASSSGQKLMVCLKLFNMIATEKGAGILEKGGIFPGSNLIEFFNQRPSLKKNIIHFELDNITIAADTFWSQLNTHQNYHTTIKTHKDID